MNTRKRPVETSPSGLISLIVYVTPLIIFFIFFYLSNREPSIYRYLTREDGLVEWCTFLNYFIASLIGFAITRDLWPGQKLSAVLYLIFSTSLMFIAGEEISWGQRLFNFLPPEFFLRNNFQLEMNIHNLAYIQDIDPFFAAKIFTIIGIYGGFGWLLMGLVSRIYRSDIHSFYLGLFIPRLMLSSYFLIVGAYFFYLAFLWPEILFVGIGNRYQEICEFILSTGFLFFCFLNIKKLKKKV